MLECPIYFTRGIMIPNTVRYTVESKATIYSSLEKVCPYQVFFLFTFIGLNNNKKRCTCIIFCTFYVRLSI